MSLFIGTWATFWKNTTQIREATITISPDTTYCPFGSTALAATIVIDTGNHLEHRLQQDLQLVSEIHVIIGNQHTRALRSAHRSGRRSLTR